MVTRKRPLVSVILPAFDAAGTLRRTIDSLSGQTFTDWELVVVDDGSTDETPGLLAALAGREPRLRCFIQPHGGIVSALNHAMARARGSLFARMDADDVAAPERLAEQVAALAGAPGLGVVSCLVGFGGDALRHAGFARHVAWLNGLISPEAIARNRFIDAPVAHPTVMFRRQLVERYGGYRDGAFPEDYELWLRWLEQGVQFAKVPRELLTWSDSPTRLSRCDPRYAPEAFQAVKAPFLVRAVANCAQGREVWVWGAGRVTRRRVDRLAVAGLRIAGFIDVDRKKWGRHRDGRRVIGPAELPSPRVAVVVVHVGRLGARDYIRAQLEAAGYREEFDFWVAA